VCVSAMEGRAKVLHSNFFWLFPFSRPIVFNCDSVSLAVMQDRPCRMRGMFGEGMRETHQALYVAEKLIHQFLPKLTKHFEKETIHITMFATQWLLTQFTSSFRFDLVTRVWGLRKYWPTFGNYRIVPKSMDPLSTWR
jgi:hypothetical protein